MVYFKYSWPDIELSYVRGIEQEDGKTFWPQLGDISKKYDCEISYLREQARKGKWKDKRASYLLKLEFSDGETTIPDPKAELEKFNVRCYQLASNSLTIIASEMKNKKNHNFQDLIVMVKLLEKIQLIGKNNFTEMSDEFEKAIGDFERLMKKLKEDEKEEKVLPEQLPGIQVIDL